MSVNNLMVSLEFADVVLPVAQDESGRDVVPLKPITDVFGLQWERQRKRVQEPEKQRRLGTCTVQMYGAGQQREMVCIRIDRVATYLFSLSAESIRSAGNEDGAAYLERKQEEWDNVLHAYEQHVGGTIRISQRSKQVRDLALIARVHKATDDPKIRSYLAATADQLATDLGLPHQSDLPMQATTT